jgi:hypothetical protein
VTSRWRGRRGFTGGLVVARSAGTPRGSDDGCVGQGGAVGFSSETTGGSDDGCAGQGGAVGFSSETTDGGGWRKQLDAAAF